MNSPGTPPLSGEQILALDRRYVWHPYSSLDPGQPLHPVAAATGAYIELCDGRRLLDGMASWWSMIHGYNHPRLNEALIRQSQCMSHVMFGGLTHEPAVRLAQTLVELAPAGLERVFFADSGSVSIEVAIKMAVQYWLSQRRPDKTRLLALRGGYHGDTLGAMSVCDPVTGMHHLFSGLLPQQIFADAPPCRFGTPCTTADIAPLRQLLEQHHGVLAAVILEPIVQGTGGMRFYSADYLREVRRLCDEFDVLLIADEIATGFGRTGRMFACEHAGISPDILCVGKALTGGYLTLAATLCSDRIARGICDGEAGVFMHGPTFMANPLACAVALESITLLKELDWPSKVATLSTALSEGLAPIAEVAGVKEVRVLGAIGVVELDEAVEMKRMVPLLVDEGLWLRPFGKLLYTMPPYILDATEAENLTCAMERAVRAYLRK